MVGNTDSSGLFSSYTDLKQGFSLDMLGEELKQFYVILTVHRH